MDEKSNERTKRRSFLKGVITGAFGALGVAGAVGTGRGGQTFKRGGDKASRPIEILYRETPEFRRYYEQLRN